MKTSSYHELTEAPIVEAECVPAERTSVNRALADALAVVHRVSHVLLARRTPDPNVPLSPEQKLLLALSGEVRNETEIAVAVGDEVRRWQLLARRVNDTISFGDAERGQVEDVRSEQHDLPPEVEHRVTVIVRWPGPLTVGDSLVSERQPLGVIESVVDDGHPPRVYTPHANGLRRVTRVLPTARQQVFARAIGAYSPLSQTPVDGMVMRDDQLDWLARSGGRALISELSAYTTGDTILRTRVYETLVKGEPVADGWTATRGEPEQP